MNVYLTVLYFDIRGKFKFHPSAYFITISKSTIIIIIIVFSSYCNTITPELKYNISLKNFIIVLYNNNRVSTANQGLSSWKGQVCSHKINALLWLFLYNNIL